MQAAVSVGFSTDQSASASASAPAAMRKQWEVEFSRFFNFPRWSSAAPAGLRALPKGKMRSKGTWLTSASPSILLLHKPLGTSAPVLSVTVTGLGYALEEHFVSNLFFSWPQVSCVSQCPVRGSRVVFMSYMDFSGQIQKFAVRFPTCSDAEAFLNFVKECSRGTADIVPPESDFVCGNSSQSEIISSSGLHHSFEEPTTMNDHEMPALSYNNEQPDFSHHAVPSSSAHPVPSSFPPSFTELVTNCSSDTEKSMSEQTKTKDGTDHASHDEEHLMDPLCKDAPKQLDSMSEADIKTKVVKYMSDANFHEMLFTLEKVIDELGGDLTL